MLCAFHLTRTLQLAVEAVDPTVVPALKRLAIAACRHDLGGAVPANVVEAPQLAVLCMGQEDRLVDDACRFEVTDPRQLAPVPDELPRAIQESGFFNREDRRV